MAIRKGLVVGFAVATVGAAVCFLVSFGTKTNSSETAVMTLSGDGHYTAPVMINGHGPYFFIVDTGAQRSVISSALATQIGLYTLPGASVTATSGNGAGGISLLRYYSSALFQHFGEMVVVLPPGGVVKDGVIGMNLFTSSRLELDFASASVRVDKSGISFPGFIPIHSSVIQGTFLVTDIFVDGISAKAMVDTGARRTIGNSRLREALGISEDDIRLSPAEPVGGATSAQTKAVRATVGSMLLGPHYFNNPTITFADIPVLKSLGLSDKPAVVLGLDVLTTLKSVAIDYPRRELQIKP